MGPGMRTSTAAAIALWLALAACQVPFFPKKRMSVQPDRAKELGLQGPVEVAVESPVWSRGGVIRAQGEVKNLTGVALQTCSVNLRILADNGTPVGGTTAYTLGGLEPGETWSFEATTTGVPITDKYYQVEIGRVVVVPKQPVSREANRPGA